MFLLGSPGPQRRWLALAFCELLKREAEVISITRDTTESDLKQRREIRDGSAIFSDQGPVRAAIEGRVLILDGIEKAERNVLPTLNCLLESREMQLDDGRFLCPPKRYDELVKEDRNGTLATRLVRVHDHFRVIALGLPVPPFPGKPLDPPLRSRFQARSIGSPPASEIYATLVNRFGVSQAALFRNLSCLSEALADGSDGDSKELLFPPFPTEQLPQVHMSI
jgi:MoxR-like ATPase